MAGNKFLVTDPTTGGSKEAHGTQVGGVAAANQIVALSASGQLDPTMMPNGVGADISQPTASEAISAGALVNLWNNGGVFSVRNADNTATGKEAHGYVQSAVASGAVATVYLNGIDAAVSGLTPGDLFLGAAGAVTATAPTAAGTVVQRVGVALSATSFQFDPLPPILLA